MSGPGLVEETGTVDFSGSCFVDWHGRNDVRHCGLVSKKLLGSLISSPDDDGNNADENADKDQDHTDSGDNVDTEEGVVELDHLESLDLALADLANLVHDNGTA